MLAYVIINCVIIFDLLLKVVSDGFLHCKITTFPFVSNFGQILRNYSDIHFLIKFSSICFGTPLMIFKSSFLLKLLVDNLLQRRAFSSTPLIYLFIFFFTGIRIRGFSFYSRSCNLIVYFDVPVNQIWLVVVLSNGLLVLFTYSHESLRTSLLFWHSKMFQDHLELFLTYYWNQPFWFLLVESGIHKWSSGN